MGLVACGIFIALRFSISMTYRHGATCNGHLSTHIRHATINTRTAQAGKAIAFWRANCAWLALVGPSQSMRARCA